MRLLVTGALGFVAPYVVDAVRRQAGGALEILATARETGDMPDGTPTEPLDVTDAQAVAAAVQRFGPTHVVHLAGVTSLAGAANDPNGAWAINLIGTLNVARALIAGAPGATLLFAGTGMSYGETGRDGRDLTEDDLPRPNSEYGASKTAADLALGSMADQGVTMLRMRPFNHTGATQPPSFAIPSFADQIARIEAGLQEPVMRVGNLDVIRDFLDVRDVATCYAQALAAGLASGTILNVASGDGRTIRSLLDTLLAGARRPIRVETDPARVREGEIERFIGSSAKARALLGWQPAIPFDDTLGEVLAGARKRHHVA